MRALPLAAALVLTLACVRPAPSPTGGGETPPELALPPDVRPLRYALDLTLLPERDRFEGAMTIEVELTRPLSRFWLHARDLTIRRAVVEVAGALRPALVTAANADGVARLAVGSSIPAGRATVRLAFDGAFVERGPGLARGWAGRQGYAFARLGPGEARRVFPCLDDPALEAPFEVTLTVRADALAISSAPALAEEALPGELKRVRFAPTAPIPAHLLALAAGPFELVAPAPLAASGPRAAPLPVRLFRPRGTPSGDHALALEAARQLVPTLEAWLGTGFPYPSFDLVLAPVTGEEVGVASGAVVAPAARLAFRRGHDAEARQLEVAGLLARALARQWVEGLVAPAAPEDAWIPGGFAALLEAVALERWRPEAKVGQGEARAIAAEVRRSGLASGRPLRPPRRLAGAAWPSLDAAGEVHAAAVLRAVERLAGEERFRAGVAAHLAAHARGAASTAQLADAISRTAGWDVNAALRALLDEPGAPLVEARSVCDSAGPHLDVVVGRFRPLGSHAAPLAYTLPVCARFEAAGDLGERCMVAERGRGVLPLPACPRWIMPDAGGRSWLVFALGPADAARLRDTGFAHLAAPERVALGASILASAEAGRIAFGEALEALSPLARDGAAAVALVPADAFGEAINHLVPDEVLPRARSALSELYLPQLRALGVEPASRETLERRGFRVEVARLLVTVARDPEVTHALAARGAAYAGVSEGHFRAEAVSPELAELALAAAVIDGDAAVFDALVRRLLNGIEGEERERALAALGSARDSALSDRALALAGEPRLPAGDRVALLRHQAAWPETREAAWKALQLRWNELVEALPPSDAAELPRAAAGLCDRKRLDEARRFFDGRVARFPLARRAAEETLERIEACVALREAQGASAVAYFTRG